MDCISISSSILINIMQYSVFEKIVIGNEKYISCNMEFKRFEASGTNYHSLSKTKWCCVYDMRAWKGNFLQRAHSRKPNKWCKYCNQLSQTKATSDKTI